MSVIEDHATRLLLEFLAEHRCAVAPQAQALLGCSPGLARRRLRRLADAGLVRSERIFAGRPSTCRITASGLSAIGSSLAPPRLHLSHYSHDLGLGWLWLAARAGAFGDIAVVYSERSMRSHDARRGATDEPLGAGIGVSTPGGSAQRHYPDLLLETPAGRRIAVELELSGKSPRRLAGIMLSYAADARIDMVLYLVADRRLATRIQRAARDAGIADLVRVQPVVRSIQGGPASGHDRALRMPSRQALAR